LADSWILYSVRAPEITHVLPTADISMLNECQIKILVI